MKEETKRTSSRCQTVIGEEHWVGILEIKTQNIKLFNKTQFTFLQSILLPSSVPFSSFFLNYFALYFLPLPISTTLQLRSTRSLCSFNTTSKLQSTCFVLPNFCIFSLLFLKSL